MDRTFEVSGPSTHVYRARTKDNRPSFWPARVVPEGTIVDLRMFGPADPADPGTLGFFPDKLLALGLDPRLVECAGTSEPAGFALVLPPMP